MALGSFLWNSSDFFFFPAHFFSWNSIASFTQEQHFQQMQSFNSFYFCLHNMMNICSYNRIAGASETLIINKFNIGRNGWCAALRQIHFSNSYPIVNRRRYWLLWCAWNFYQARSYLRKQTSLRESFWRRRDPNVNKLLFLSNCFSREENSRGWVEKI